MVGKLLSVESFCMPPFGCFYPHIGCQKKSLKLLPPHLRFKAKMHQNWFHLGLCPRPCCGACSAPSDLLPGI